MSSQLTELSLRQLLDLRANHWRELEHIGIPHESEVEKQQKYNDVIVSLSDVEAELMQRRAAERAKVPVVAS